MAMTTGSRGGPVASINMTPMIDVLLVLLIIFMVVQQGLQRGVSVQVPPPPSDLAGPVGTVDLVLEVESGGTYRLNQQPVAAGALQATLARVFAPRPRKVLFVKGGEQVAYAEVVRAVDVSRLAGVDVVGLVPRAVAQ
ncbi:MAG TPA: biopolymer transporter ExbD [Longimicrobium sp.]|jgi:biopolymer transport protein ExbD